MASEHVTEKDIGRILREKYAVEGRADFAFYQAYYSRCAGVIERTRLTLCQRPTGIL